MLRTDAISIWQAGVDAVRPDRLISEQVHIDHRWLRIENEAVDLSCVRQIAIVGAGKAGVSMCAALEAALGPRLIREKQVHGWVNVPADCVPADGPPKIGVSAEPSGCGAIHLHPARPAGVNEPTAEAAEGTRQILEIVRTLTADDLCIALLSGGGSALLPAPVEGVSLDDKLRVTRFLSAAGADISELNTVRKQLSRIKGGGLARACRAGRLLTLVISDIPGDPLDLIASGPTVADRSTPDEALEVLDKFHGRDRVSPAVFDALERRAALRRAARNRTAAGADHPLPPSCRTSNHIIGSNRQAVDAAAKHARQLGYTCESFAANKPEGPVESIGRHLAEKAASLRNRSGRQCFVSGGEGTATLAPELQRGRGGRNQQTALAALVRLTELGSQGVAIFSGGTDGEDGPTDAAGAVVDADVIEAAHRLRLDAADHLRRNDAYRFFEPLGALVKTGPTHTNVCDIRVVVTQAE